MTTTEPSSHTFARVLTWLSTGNDDDRSNIQLSSQTAQQPPSFDAHSLLIISRIAVSRAVGSARHRSRASSAAIKDAMRRTKARLTLSAASFVPL
jgi:hypothetical protein